jgi:hypothetical protein
MHVLAADARRCTLEKNRLWGGNEREKHTYIRAIREDKRVKGSK